MKKIVLLLLFLPFSAFAQSTYQITGEFSNNIKTGKIFLTYRRAGERSHWDSSVVKDGVFNFQGTIRDTLTAQLMMDYEGKGLDDIWGKDNIDERQIYLAPAIDTKLTINTTLHAARATGALVNTELGEYLDGVALTYTLAERKVFDRQFAEKHPKSLVSIDFALTDLARIDFDAQIIQKLLSALNPELRDTKTGRELQQRINSSIKTCNGCIAPQISLPDTKGKLVSLTAFKGKYVLIDFWASWCKPCREANPALIKIYEDYRLKNFTILGVSLDEASRRNQWLKAITTDKLKWTQLSDLKGWNSTAAKDYAVTTIPQNFLLDPQGRIIAQGLDHGALEKLLKVIFSDKEN